MNVTDTDDNPVSAVSVVQQENTAVTQLVGRIPCVAGMFLKATDAANARVLARVADSGDPFVDIGLFPIDLTPYAGLNEDFEFRIEADDAASPVEYVELPVVVTFNP